MPHPTGGARRRAVAALAAVTAWLAVPAPAAAHAELAVSEPGANASLAMPPAEIRLEFTEPIDPRTAEVEILDPNQVAVDGLGPVVVTEDGLTATVEVPRLPDGVYVVRYRVLSIVDGHVTGGSFAFGVDSAGGAPPPAVPPTTEAPGADAASAASRGAALAGALTLVGSSLFWLASAGPALRGRGARSRPPWGLLLAASALAAGGLVASLTWSGRNLPIPPGALPFDPAAPYGATPFGIAMRVALGAAVVAGLVALLALLGARRDPRGGTRLPWVLVAIGLVVLAAMSFAGHAAALGGPMATAFDLGHLVAVAAWLGALPGYAALAVGSRHLAASDRRSILGVALRRHGRVSLVAAPIVALTGIANSPVVLGGTRDLVASEYGNLLLAKAVLFSTAVGIGAANFFLVRRVALRRAAITIGVELAVAALAVLVAAGMLTVPVAASRAPRLVTAEVPSAHLYDESDAIGVHAIVSVPSPGNQAYQAVIAPNGAAGPLDDVQRVFMTFIPPPGSDLGAQRIRLEEAGPPGVYEADGAYTPLVGSWGLELTVRREGLPDETFAFDLDVRAAPPPERLPPPDTGVGVPAPLGALWRLVPPPPLEWLPTLVLFGAGGLVWAFAPTRGADRRQARRLARVRAGFLALGVAAGVVTGSRVMVLAANAGLDGVLPTENPVPATSASVAAGEASYRATCLGCHGGDGEGDGPMSAGLGIPPSDLRLHVPFHTDAELYAIITRGVSGTPMPGFATELSPEERWNLVNYLRSRWPTP